MGGRFVSARQYWSKFQYQRSPLLRTARRTCGERVRSIRDLDPLRDEGWSFSASSRQTFAVQRIGLAAAVGDAMMVDALVARDTLGVAPPRGPARHVRVGWVGGGARFAECSES